MLRSIAHRGPDAEGQYRNAAAGAQVALGHRRLSIIDLSDAANQPFVKNGLALAYNGEIYNFQELRRELIRMGVNFRTNSDTEVVLEAWRAWGAASLKRLRGMFAFALFDENTGRMVLARDHLGIKPLFMLKRQNGVAFASELKALRPVLGPDTELNHTAMVASLMYYWVPDSHCVLKGVEKLPAGHWAEFSPIGQMRLHTFWDAQVELVERQRQPVTVPELRSILEKSVADHMIADVPVATFLSGGLDSSLITVLAARANADIDCYTIAFRSEDQRFEAMPDDLFYARKVAKDYDLRLHEIEIAPDVANMLPRIVDVLDEPIGDAAAINTYLICEAARKAGVKALLSGMGADELFGGYRKHYASLLAKKYQRIPGFVRHEMIERLVGALPVAGGNRGYKTVRWAKRFIDFASLPEETAFRRSYTHYDREGFHSLLAPELWSSVEQLFYEHAAIYHGGPEDDHVNRMCYTDTRLFLSGLNLTYTDRASMAASTEVRVPFVDWQVAEAAFSIPGEQKIVGRERKAILKQAAEAWLPKEIIYRPKGLFSAPLRAWIRRDLGEMINDVLPNGALVKDGLLRGEKIRSLIDEDRRGTADRSKEIWQLLTLETWYQRQWRQPAEQEFAEAAE